MYIEDFEVMAKSALLLIVSALLVYGNRALKPALYWPFIVYVVS
jgi:hypothetical protein